MRVFKSSTLKKQNMATGYTHIECSDAFDRWLGLKNSIRILEINTKMPPNEIT